MESVWIDLPSLQSIELGYNSLCGSNFDSSCSLTMRSSHCYLDFRNVDLPKLSSLTSSRGFSFCYPRSVIFESKRSDFLMNI